jgi:outer membrane protein OmpA-like peptidoglycan-associated protein
MIARAGSCVLRNAIVTAIVTASAIALLNKPAAAQGYPQSANGSSVIVNYGALGPVYGAPVYGAPGYVPPAYGAPGYSLPVYGAQNGYAPYVPGSLPRSTFTPYSAQVYSQSGLRYAPMATGFAPYGAGPQYGSTPYAQTVPYAQAAPFGSYAEKVVLKNPAKKKKKKSTAQASYAAPVESQPASTPTATETQVAETPAPQVPAAEPAAAPVPPAEPETMPTNVPSPVPTTPPADVAATPAAPATPTPPATEPAPDATATAAAAPAAAATDQQAAVTPEAPAAETPAAETPAEPAATDPNASAALPAGGVRIVFEGDADELPGASTGDLDQIAQKMLADENMRVQVMAYANGTPETENKARRKSLARGLAVRSYLIKAGVRSTRIDVRALGSKTEGTPPDRVDVVPAS